MTSDTKFWLGLSLAPSIGTVRIQKLIETFGSAQSAWGASRSALERVGLSANSLNAFIAYRDKANLDQEFDKVHKYGAHLITLADDNYPLLLRKISAIPPILYVKGHLLPQDMLALAVVGTRNATTYGRDVTFKITRELAQQGVTIVSGLAQGIDTAAHRGALAGDGRTIVVLGCGIDQIYPSQNKDLAQDILVHQRGAIISEFPIGTPPHKINFPRRNRIMSGLALGVLITEAPEKSGALITAEYALEQGRDVYAIPASIFSPNSMGTNRLIQDGAKLVTAAQDILSELNISRERTSTQQATEIIAPETPEELSIYNILGYEPLHIDDIIRASGYRADTVVSTITLLELKGLAQMVGYMHYCRSHES